jgi:hypothetical protein
MPLVYVERAAGHFTNQHVVNAHYEVTLLETEREIAITAASRQTSESTADCSFGGL